MSAPGPVPRPLCALIWALLLATPMALAVGIGLPWWQHLQRLEERAAASIEQIQRYQQVLGTLPALKAELGRIEADQAYKAFYFDASTPALAGAELQRRLQEIVQAADGRLISTQLLSSPPDEQPPQIRIRTQLQGTTETLLDVLFAIEQARPFLFVDHLSVRSSARPSRPTQLERRAVRRRSPFSQEQGLLTIRLDLFGYALRGE